MADHDALERPYAFSRWDTFKGLILLVQILILPTVGWGVSEILSNRDRLTSIESSRFTANDGRDLWKEIAQSRAEIAQQLAAIREDLARIPTQIVPEWLREELRSLRAAIQALESKVQ